MNIKRHKGKLNYFMTCLIKDTEAIQSRKENAEKWKGHNQVCDILSSKTCKN